jgi:signal peptidase II
MSPGQSIPKEGFFRITYSENEGGIFGLPLPSVLLIVLTIIVIVAIVFVYYRYPLSREKLIKIALGFLVGGATGNLADRLFIGEFGKVTDFIDIGAWPVFNLADSATVIGVILIAYYFVFVYRKEKAKARVHGTED